MSNDYDQKTGELRRQAPSEPVYAVEEHRRVVGRHDEASQRGLVALVVGGVATLAASIPSKFYLKHKLLPFETDVLNKTRESILGRIGEAAKANPASALGGGNLAAGFSSHEIEKSFRLNAFAENSFARRIYKLGGESSVASYIGLGVGAVAAAAYFVFAPKRQPAEAPIHATNIYIPEGAEVVQVAKGGVQVEEKSSTHEKPAIEAESKIHEPEPKKNWGEEVKKDAAEKAEAEPAVASR